VVDRQSDPAIPKGTWVICKNLKNNSQAIILAIQEDQGIVVQSQPRQVAHKTLSRKTHHKKERACRVA
jgi:hypothetical protein